MKSLSVFFNSDKVYSGIFIRDAKGLSLLDVTSTLDPIDLDDLDSEYSQKGINQIKRNLSKTPHKIEEVNVILNNENAFWTIIPGSMDMQPNKLRKLLEVEIRNNIGSFQFDDFLFRIYPYGRKDDNESDMLFVVFIKKDIIENCKKALEITGLDISYITITQIAVQNTIEYNYPDASHLYDFLLNVEESFCDVSLSNQNLTYYYELIKNESESLLVEAIQNNIIELNNSGFSPGNVLAIGTNLKKSFLDQLNNKLDVDVKRLNSFRMVRADIDQRLKDYCIRTSHIYAPVVGGALNSFDKGKVIEF